MRTVSKKGVVEIAEHEGIVLGPYLDSVGVWTYGVGHTKAAGGPNPEEMPRVDTRQLSDEEAMAEVVKALELYESDLAVYERRVNMAIYPETPLKQHQFDALVSWDFNTGGALWQNPRSGRPAQLIRQINNGDYSGAGFMGWLKPKEITKRRKAEMALFQTGNYDGNGDSIPVYDALPDGRFRWRMTLRGKDVLKHMTPTHSGELDRDYGGIVAVAIGAISAVGAGIAALWDRIGGLF